MRIGIVTIYNSQNCGSFLQTYALLGFLKNQNHDVIIIRNHINFQNRFIYRLMLAIKYAAKGNFQKVAVIIQTYFKYYCMRRKYFTVSVNKKNDVLVFGSDTIWNIDDDYFAREWMHYFGGSYHETKIAYAPSIGSVKPEVILQRKELCDCLKNFDLVSVRDENTFNLIKKIKKNSSIPYVVDPTMLMEKEFYMNIASPCCEEKYILFYYFGLINSDIFNKIRDFSKKKGLKLICFGEYIPECDKRIIFTPDKMIGYFSKAEYIITNTFHGNVFSILFNKLFLNIDCGKAKVDDLLKRFKLEDRTVQSSDQVEKVLEMKIDFKKTNELLRRSRSESQAYLLNAISRKEKRNESKSAKT